MLKNQKVLNEYITEKIKLLITSVKKNSIIKEIILDVKELVESRGARIWMYIMGLISWLQSRIFYILLTDWILVLDSMLQRSALKQNDGQNVKHDCVEKITE